jgi:hypothetical protein
MVFINMMDGLPLFQQGRDKQVHPMDLFFRHGYSGTDFGKGTQVPVVRFTGIIDMLFQSTPGSFFLTSVAYKRGIQEIPADSGFIGGTVLIA